VLQAPHEEKEYSDGIQVSVMPALSKTDKAKEILKASLHDVSPIQILPLMVVLILVGEFSVMIILNQMGPLPLISEALIDAGILVVIITLGFYYFHYKPTQLENIYDRKKLIEELIINEERLNLTLTAINDGFWDWDITTNKTYFSPRWETMLGYEPGEIKAHIRSWANLIHPDDLNIINEQIQAHFSGNQDDIQSELRMQTKTGQWHWVLVRGKVILRNRDGKPLRALGTQTDIQSKKNFERELNAKSDRIRTLSHQLIKNSEEEKKHLAQDLHDEFGQLLTAFQLGIEMIHRGQFTEQSALNSQCVRLLNNVKHMEKELRRICDNLRPDILDDLGLNEAIKWLASQFSIFNKIQVKLKLELNDAKLSSEEKLVFYRICQESLNNINKHASATLVTIDLQESAETNTLTIRDNGCGFNPEEIGKKKKYWGMGLLGMNERAAALSGSVTVNSASGKGTTILAALPKASI
ncbi:sensor histidine kinase, partial [Kaarinaea lacus]